MIYTNHNINSTKIQVLEDISSCGKLIDWKGKKINSSFVADSYERIGSMMNIKKYTKKSERVRSCGSFLVYKKYSDGTKKLHSGDFCKDRLCPMCNWRRSLKIYGQVSKVMDNLLLEDKKYRFIFLTLTCKNVAPEELSDSLDKLFYSFRKLFNRPKVKKSCLGWFRALEVTHNLEYDTFHPHFHVIIAVEPKYFKKSDLYISQNLWTSYWKECLEVDYNPIVHITAFKTNTDSEIRKSIAETAKYTVKDSDYIIKNNPMLTDMTIYNLDSALYKRRLCAFGGVLKKIHKELNLDDAMDGDLINTDSDEEIRKDLDYILETYCWSVGYSNYIKQLRRFK